MQVLVIAELLEGKLRSNTLSAVNFAKQASEAHGSSYSILSIGHGAKAAASELASFGANNVFVAEIEGGYIAERYAATVAKVANEHGFHLLTATATSFGKDLLPRLAAKLDAGIASDISAFEVKDGKNLYTRPMYAGNVFGTMEITSAVHVVSVRQSEFAAATATSSQSTIEEVEITNDPVAERLQFVELRTVQSERPELSEARVVVSGGRSLKSAENFKTVLEPLVDTLNAAMGASRAACDAGYVPGELQVGQTGKVVAPELYIAVGISGAIQHLAGMKSSKVIVAINKDKEAPIAQVADYFWAEDLFKAVPELTAAIQKLK